MQLGEIDALAIEAEAPTESRYPKTDHDDAPAVVAGRGLVDGFFTEAMQRLPLRLSRRLGRDSSGPSAIFLTLGTEKTWMRKAGHGDKLTYWHVQRLDRRRSIMSQTGSGNSDTACRRDRRLANDASVNTVSPSSTGGYTTMLTADQP